MAAAKDPRIVTSRAPEMISSLPEASVRINELLDSTGDLEILLLGRSGAGKSSFINAMFDKDLAAVGDITTAETQEVTTYVMTGVKETNIKVFDSPGFESKTGFRKQKKYVKAIKEACQTVDYIFLCIRLDDQLQKSDEDGLKCLVNGFGSYPGFWKKMTIIFTRANSVYRHLEGKEWQDKMHTITRQQMHLISHLLTRKNSRIVLNEDQYSVAGSPFEDKKRKKRESTDDKSGTSTDSRPDDAATSISDINYESVNPIILRPEQYYDDRKIWVPHLIGSLLESNNDDIQKIKLLKTQLTKKEIAAHTTLNGSSAVGLGVGIACCIVGAGASIAGPVGPAIGIPLITIGATTIAISATAGASTNTSLIVKGARKIRNRKANAKKQSAGYVHKNPNAESDSDSHSRDEDEHFL